MPKGIRKACANCIKARLACDEGRPCQRCVVHACECVAVPRKPRVKKQKIDLDPPAPSELHIPSIDLNCDVVVPNWSQGEFAQGAFGAFQLDRTIQPEESQFDGFAPNTHLSPASSQSLSPMFLDSPSSFQLTPPVMSSQIPSPPQLFTPPSSPVTHGWPTQNIHTGLIQQLILPQPSSLLQSQPQQPQAQAQIHVVQQPIQPVHTIPQNLSQNISPLSLSAQQNTPLVQQQFTQDIKSQSYDNSQMLSLLMEEKPSALLNEWQGTHNQFSNFAADVAQQMQSTNFYDPTLFKKHLNSHISPLPQAMNATPLFPAPIAVFDKMRFQLLDANNAMAEFIGLANVAEMASKVNCMDDLIDSEAAQIAKQAYVNFVANPSPYFRLGEVRTYNGTANKTVEFHVDLTEQLLILTIKNVFDSSSRSLPDVRRYPSQYAIKTDMSVQQSKAFEFLSPID